MRLPVIFKSKIFLVVIGLVLCGLFALELQQWQQRRKIDTEIAKLQQQQNDLESRNKALQESLSYFKTDNYQDKIAREQLGLKKEGEIVVNFPPENTNNTAPANDSIKKSNLLKWWEYIFNKTNS